MDESTKLTWLRRVLLLKVAVCFLVWGLPALTGPASFLNLFGVTIPEDPFFLRVFGAGVVAQGVLYFFGYQDPLRNRDIVRYGVVDNTLVTLTILVLAFTVGLSSWFFWVSLVLTAFFAVAFYFLMPQKQV